MPNKWDEINRQNVLQRRVAGEAAPTVQELADGLTGQTPQEPETRIVEVAPENAIVRRDDGAMVYKRFVMTATGMEIPADVTGEEWQDVGAVVMALDSSIAWNVGDWAACAMETWKMTASQIAEMFNYSAETIEGYASICRAIHGLVRHQALSFDTHRPVAKLVSEKQMYWLDRAETEGWNRQELYAAINPPRTVTAPTLPPNVTEGREQTVKRLRALEAMVSGKKKLDREVIQREGRAIIEWVQQLMEASE